MKVLRLLNEGTKGTTMSSDQTKSLGKILPEGTMILREEIGHASQEDGTVYEVCVSLGNRTPLIRNNKTGKWFQLDWQDIIELAKANGVDEA